MSNPDFVDCPFCGASAHYNGRSYDCDACDTRWTPHNLSVSKEVVEHLQERAEQREEAREMGQKTISERLRDFCR